MYPFAFKLGDKVRVPKEVRIQGGRTGTVVALELHTKGTSISIRDKDGKLFRLPESLVIRNN